MLDWLSFGIKIETKNVKETVSQFTKLDDFAQSFYKTINKASEYIKGKFKQGFGKFKDFFSWMKNSGIKGASFFKDTYSGLKKLFKGASNLGKGLGGVSDKAEEVNEGIENMREEIKKTDDTVKKSNFLQKLSVGLSSIAVLRIDDVFNKMNEGLESLKEGIEGATDKTDDAADNWNEYMSQLQAFGLSGREIEVAHKTIINAIKDTYMPIEDAIELFEDLRKTGLEVGDIEKVMPLFARLKNVFGLDDEALANMLSTMKRANMGLSEFQQIIGTSAAIGQKYKLSKAYMTGTFEVLQNVFNRFGTVGLKTKKQLLDFSDQLVKIYAFLIKKGQLAPEKAQEAISNLSEKFFEMRDEIGKLMAGRITEFPQTIQELIKAGGGVAGITESPMKLFKVLGAMAKEGKNLDFVRDTLNELFGPEMTTALMKNTDQLGSYLEELSKMKGGAKDIDKMTVAMWDNVKVAREGVTRMKELISAELFTLGAPKVQKVFKDYTNRLAQTLDKLRAKIYKTNADGSQEFTKFGKIASNVLGSLQTGFLGIVSSLGVVGDVIATFGAQTLPLLGILTQFGFDMRFFGSIFSKVGGVFKKTGNIILKVFDKLTFGILGALGKLSMAFLTNPITAALMAITAVVGGLYILWKKDFMGMKKIFDKEFKPLQDELAKTGIKFKGLGDLFKQVVKKIIGPVLKNLMPVIKTVVGFMVQIVVDIIKVFRSLRPTIEKSLVIIGKIFKNIFDSIFIVVKSVLEGVGKVFDSFGKGPAESFGNLFTNILGVILKFTEGIKAIAPVISAVAKSVISVVNFVIKVFSKLYDTVYGIFGEKGMNILTQAVMSFFLLNLATKKMSVGLGKLSDKFLNFGGILEKIGLNKLAGGFLNLAIGSEKLKNIFGKGLIPMFKNLATKLLPLMFSPAGLWITGILAVAAGAYLIYKNWDKIIKWLKKAVADASAFMRDRFEIFFKGISEMAEGIKGVYMAVWNTIKSIFENLKGLFTGELSFKEAFSNMWNDILGNFAKGVESILKVFSGLAQVIYGELAGVFDSIFGKGTFDKIMNFFNNIIKSLAVIFSPKKWFQLITGKLKFEDLFKQLGDIWSEKDSNNMDEAIKKNKALLEAEKQKKKLLEDVADLQSKTTAQAQKEAKVSAGKRADVLAQTVNNLLTKIETLIKTGQITSAGARSLLKQLTAPNVLKGFSYAGIGLERVMSDVKALAQVIKSPTTKTAPAETPARPTMMVAETGTTKSAPQPINVQVQTNNTMQYNIDHRAIYKRTSKIAVAQAKAEGVA